MRLFNRNRDANINKKNVINNNYNINLVLINFIKQIYCCYSMTKGERFGKAVNYLRMQGIVAKNEDVAVKMGADPSNVSRSIKGTGGYPSDSFLRRFNMAFDNTFNLQWLLTGDGEMIEDAKPTVIVAGENNVYSIPLLPVSAQGGSLNDFVVSVKDSDCEKIISPIKGADYAMSVAGDSMSPEYPSGSQILIKRINERAFIDWGKVYVLDTCNGTVIKQLFPSKKAGMVICKSINPKFPPFEVSMTDVYGVYRVLMCMSVK